MIFQQEFINGNIYIYTANVRIIEKYIFGMKACKKILSGIERTFYSFSTYFNNTKMYSYICTCTTNAYHKIYIFIIRQLHFREEANWWSINRPQLRFNCTCLYLSVFAVVLHKLYACHRSPRNNYCLISIQKN